MKVHSTDLRSTGGDLRWNTPVAGLIVGSSVHLNKFRANQTVSYYGQNLTLGSRVNPERIVAAYADYTHGNWHFSAEGRTDHHIYLTTIAPAIFGPGESATDEGFTAWYVTAAYRISKRLEVGTYRSQYECSPSPSLDPTQPTVVDPNSKHIYDQTVTARIDLTKFWNVKLEGHFIQGYGNNYAARGFYPANNPGGLQPNTNLLSVRTGWNF
jgi:hypothetical protein